jgi:hypothetical protein
MQNAIDEGKLQRRLDEVRRRVAKKKLRDEMIKSAVEAVRMRVADRKRQMGK